MTAPINEPRTPPYKLAGVVLTILLVAATALVYFQFRGDNDEAWQRAERFVSEEVRDRLLESRPQQ